MRSKLLGLWSAIESEKDEADRLRKLSKSGRAIEDMLETDAWKSVLEAKEYYQAVADVKTKAVTASDKDRFMGAVEYAALEGFFREIYGRVRKGKDAEKKLKGLYQKTS